MAAKKAGSRNTLSSSEKQICDLVEMPAGRNIEGTGILVAVIVGDGTDRQVQYHAEKYVDSLPAGRQSKRQDDLIVQLLSAVASNRRLTMLKAMMAGADSYAKLRKAVSQSAGPMYYHVRELVNAGLVEQEHRDVYKLTERGKHLLLIADSAVKLVTR
jgi:predicted transcriptional regulator